MRSSEGTENTNTVKYNSRILLDGIQAPTVILSTLLCLKVNIKCWEVVRGDSY